MVLPQPVTHVLAAFAVLCALPAQAEDRPIPPPEAAEAATADADTADTAGPDTTAAQHADDWASWIQQLDADQFLQRQQASRRLLQAGQAAIPALAEAAGTGSREAMLRALDILRKHLHQGNHLTQSAAREALEQLAQRDDSAVARRAKQALESPADDAPAVAQAPGRIPFGPGQFPLPALPIAPAQIQIQVQAVARGGPGVRQIRVKTVNGVKDIEVQEDGRKVKIHEDPQKGIQMEVTEKKNDEQITQKYQAKDLEELKKNHPQAHAIYEKYQQFGMPRQRGRGQ